MEKDFELTINADIKTAMKQKDAVALRTLRSVKAEILVLKTDGSGRSAIDEATAIKVIQKMIRQRSDSMEIFEKQDREDLARVERDEVDVLEKYLPKQLSEEDLESKIAEIVQRLGASSIRDMGKVMGVANTELAGSADGKAIGAMAKKLLTT
jgi:uncharacterized protein YqeY